MLVFIDTEFTNHNSPSLISLGLVADGVEDFYAELTDFPLDQCSAFVVSEVLPLLGRILGAACIKAELSRRLQSWFDALPEAATILYDYETDLLLLQAACGGVLPSSVIGTQIVDQKMFRHPAYKLGEILVYSNSQPHHHALADAKALREGFVRWTARTTTWGNT